MAAVASSTRARVCCALFAVLPAVMGCDFETAGLEDLLDSDPSYLNAPGKRLAEGRFSELEIDGSEKGDAAVLALRDGQELSIAPFDGRGACNAGAAAKFGHSLAPGSTKKEYVPFVEAPDASGYGTLRFSDFDCALSTVNLPESGLPLDQLLPFAAEPREFALSRGAELHVLDPWHDMQGKVAGSVTRAELANGALWTIENGELVQRDTSLAEVRRLGSSVSELVVDDLGKQAAYVDAEGVHLIEAADESPILLDGDACELSNAIYGRFKAWIWLSYLSPCSSRRLVSIEIESRARFEFGENASSPALLYPLPGKTPPEGHAFFVTDSVTLEPRGPSKKLWAVDDVVHVGTLWGGRLGATPAKGPERALLESTSFPYLDRVRVVADFDGMTGRLVEWNVLDGSIKELAQGVAAANGPEVLSRFDGTVGDLLHIDVDFNVEVLAERVPAPSVYGTDFQRAVLSDFDGTTGTLLLFKGVSAQNAEVVAHGVPVNGFEFMWTSAIVYEDEFDPVSSTGRLVARFLKTADTFPVQPGVSEMHEVNWPEQGVLYSVTSGKSSGIWFAPAR